MDKHKNDSSGEGPESYKSDQTPKWRGKDIDKLTSEEYELYIAAGVN